MNWDRFAIACALGVAVCRPGAPRADAAAPGAGRDLAAEVRAVFSAKCAGCHGAHLARPKGRFGYVLDLQRVAGNPEMVVPSSPDESELWALVRNNEMPPSDSPSGALTAEQKEAVRAWIAAGAPAGGAPAAPSALPPTTRPADEGTRPPSVGRVLRWLGRFHLLLLHFPIALLAAAGAGELCCAWRGARAPSPAVRFCLCLGAAAAVPTVALGWLHALDGHGAGSPRLLALHRWLGTVGGLWAVGAAALSELDARRGVRSWRVRLLVLVGALLVALTGHFGGLLAHGERFFDR
jgi:mono/diheme cytochrome c family protein/uncharacterized membrane protein